MIYLFVPDGSLTSLRFTLRTEQITKCCEPLQKMRLRIGAFKIDLSPPPPPPQLSFQGDTSVVILFDFMFWSRFMCCLNLGE